jgi:hypothetical protein
MRKSLLLGLVVGLFLFEAVWSAGAAEPAAGKSPRVFLVLLDGLRWKEVFAGADESLINKEVGGVPDVAALRKKYWQDTPEARRAALMPFLWSKVAGEGAILGNQEKGSVMKLSNEIRVSFPGYSEMTVGWADPRIENNDHKLNPNVNVFEWLNQKPAFKGKVAAFASWNAVPFILNRERSGLFICAADEPIKVAPVSPQQELLNRIRRDVPVRYDVCMYEAMVEYIRAQQPRVVFFAYGETDEYAHEGRYDEYLDAAQRADRFLKTLWETLQTLPEYKDQTTLIISNDHGRGDGPEWKHHGKKIAGAENVWTAVLGPDTPALGEYKPEEPVILAQVAATVAAAVCEDYPAAAPQAANPLPGVLGKKAK